MQTSSRPIGEESSGVSVVPGTRVPASVPAVSIRSTDYRRMIIAQAIGRQFKRRETLRRTTLGEPFGQTSKSIHLNLNPLSFLLQRATLKLKN